MFEPTRLRALVLLGCLAMSFWLPSMPSTAHAAQPTRCSVSEGTSHRLNLSSEVEGQQVKLCGNWAKVKSSVTQSKTKINPRTPKKTADAKKLKHPKSVVLTTRSGKRITFTNQVTASPAAPRIGQSSTQIEVGETASFQGMTRKHSRFRLLLGAPTEIRFTPTAPVWTLDGKKSATSWNFYTSSLSKGRHLVEFSVVYRISFRLWLRGEFRRVSRSIVSHAQPAEILVGDGARHPRFVAYSCVERPMAIGCSN